MLAIDCGVKGSIEPDHLPPHPGDDNNTFRKLLITAALRVLEFDDARERR